MEISIYLKTPDQIFAPVYLSLLKSLSRINTLELPKFSEHPITDFQTKVEIGSIIVNYDNAPPATSPHHLLRQYPDERPQSRIFVGQQITLIPDITVLMPGVFKAKDPVFIIRSIDKNTVTAWNEELSTLCSIGKSIIQPLPKDDPRYLSTPNQKEAQP